MKTNKLDKSIQEKLQNRTFEPSASAWERLSIQLDEQPQQKNRGWFFYIGVAASILLVVAIGIQFLSSDKEGVKPNVIIVDTPNDTSNFDKKIDKFINEISVDEAVVANDKVEKKQEIKNETKMNIISNKVKQSQIKKEKRLFVNNDKIIIAKVENNKSNITNGFNNISKEKEKSKANYSLKSKILKRNPNSSIKINSEDLLFAVTHSSQKVKEYYAKYNVNRENILKTIKSELIKSNIKVNPNTILAEVERNIGEEDFQNNFIKSIKKRVTDIASAIASRND